MKTLIFVLLLATVSGLNVRETSWDGDDGTRAGRGAEVNVGIERPEMEATAVENADLTEAMAVTAAETETETEAGTEAETETPDEGAMEPEGGDQSISVNGTMVNDSGDLDYEDETGSGEDYVDDVVNVDLVPTDGNLTFNSEVADNVETGSGVETVELDGSGGGEPEVDPDSDYAMGEPSNWLVDLVKSYFGPEADTLDADAEDLVSEMAEVKTAIEDFGANVTDPDLDAKIQFPAMKSVVTVNIHGGRFFVSRDISGGGTRGSTPDSNLDKTSTDPASGPEEEDSLSELVPRLNEGMVIILIAVGAVIVPTFGLLVYCLCKECIKRRRAEARMSRPSADQPEAPENPGNPGQDEDGYEQVDPPPVPPRNPSHSRFGSLASALCNAR